MSRQQLVTSRALQQSCRLPFLQTAILSLFLMTASQADEPLLRIATFSTNVTPALGSPLSYAIASKIVDPLLARGVVLLGKDKPIVLCSVDWIGIGNGGQLMWKETLAEAAGTTIDRVVVHTIHQHDAPSCDFDIDAVLVDHKLNSHRIDVPFARDAIKRTAESLRASIAHAKPVTHVGTAATGIEKVASNRRVLGPDGKVKYVRYSATKNKEAIEAPEGVIDPLARLIAFGDGKKPIAVLSYYATHPMSYYGKGDVSADFIGMARKSAEEHAGISGSWIHFNGAGGNITAGKYNDGRVENRAILANRVTTGFKSALKSITWRPISTNDLRWATVPLALPPARHLNQEKLLTQLRDGTGLRRDGYGPAADLVWLRRCEQGKTIPLTCLKLADTYVLHLPGELFVEYQLAAQQMRPSKFVAMAAYGDYAPGYIGTEIAYSQGGYETEQRSSRVDPSVEKVILNAMKDVLAQADQP